MQIGGVYATSINALATAYMATLKFKTYIKVLLRKCLTFRDLKYFFFQRRENKPVLLQNLVSFSSFQKSTHFVQRASEVPAMLCCRPTLKSRLTISEWLCCDSGSKKYSGAEKETWWLEFVKKLQREPFWLGCNFHLDSNGLLYWNQLRSGQIIPF